MRQRIVLRFLMLLIGVWLLPVGIAGADFIPVTHVIWQPDPDLDPFALSGTVEFFNARPDDSIATGYDLYIRLTNTSGNLDPVDFPAAITLTGVGFNLPAGVTIIGGAMGLSGYNPDSADDPSTIWGYDNGTGVEGGPFAAFPSFFSVNTAISTLEASVDVTFAAPAGKVDGPDGGILALGEETPNNKNYYLASAVIGLDLEGLNNNGLGSLLNAAVDGDVVIAFGSPTSVVPEPATMLLMGTGLLGIAALGRRRFRRK